MRIKVIYRKNLKMSEGKLAAQVAHAVKNLLARECGSFTTLLHKAVDCDIIVLGVSDKKFAELRVAGIFAGKNPYVQDDKGLTEVDPGTTTACAWIENE